MPARLPPWGKEAFVQPDDASQEQGGQDSPGADPVKAGDSRVAYTSSSNAKISDTATCLADPLTFAKTLSSAAMVCDTSSSVIFLSAISSLLSYPIR